MSNRLTRARHKKLKVMYRRYMELPARYEADEPKFNVQAMTMSILYDHYMKTKGQAHLAKKMREIWSDVSVDRAIGWLP